MEEKTQLVVIQCRHCPSKIRWAVPKTQGIFRVKCPSCGGDNTVQFVPKEIRMQEAANSKKADDGQQPDEAVIVTCPDCQTKMRFAPKGDGVTSMVCPKCKANIEANIKGGHIVSVRKRNTKPVATDGNLSNGKLTVLRYGGLLGSFGSKSYPLHPGQNTVGRYDEDLHSDIEIKGDASMSRRSVVIEVIQKESGYFFKLKVLKAANPVMHNHKPLIEGEVIYLNYGDKIKLGKTLFEFNKATDK